MWLDRSESIEAAGRENGGLPRGSRKFQTRKHLAVHKLRNHSRYSVHNLLADWRVVQINMAFSQFNPKGDIFAFGNLRIEASMF